MCSLLGKLDNEEITNSKFNFALHIWGEGNTSFPLVVHFQCPPPPCGTLYYLAMLVRAPLPMSRGAFGRPPPHEAVAREFLDLKEGKIFGV